MSFNTFCNICFMKEHIIKLCEEENETILNILISFTSCPDIVNGNIYLCITCCNKLEEFDKFRKLYLTNFVRFRYLYNKHKKELEIRNVPNIESQLKAFVDVNVERPSGTPLIENYEAAQAMRNNTASNLDTTCKELNELNDGLSHTDTKFIPKENTSENETQTCSVKYENGFSNEYQENIKGSSAGEKSTSSGYTKNYEIKTEDTILEEGTSSGYNKNYGIKIEDTNLEEGTSSGYNKNYEIEIEDTNLEEGYNKNEIKIEDTDLEEDEPYPHEFEFVSDTVPNVIPYRESADNANPENCGTDDTKKGKGSTKKGNITKKRGIVCNICHKILSRARDFKKHMRIHTDERPYSCDVCHKKFKQSSALKGHKRIHTGEKPYKCDDCGLEFKHSSALHRHRRTHTDEALYCCDECQKTFREFSSLKVHKRVHTGVRRYKCDECGMKFTFSSSLKRHKLTHTDEKPNSCVEYSCDECKKSFTRIYNLKIHKLIHSGDKPYKCDKCSWAFRHRCSLNNHKRTHTGEKPYVCDVCHKTFTRRIHLTKHKTIHKVENRTNVAS